MEEKVFEWKDVSANFYYLEYNDADALPDDRVIFLAKSCIGIEKVKGYNLLNWNCETVAAYFKTGKDQGFNMQGDAAKMLVAGISDRWSCLVQ